jgi:drug/metabolite transporter (DMT)-like permease
MYSRVEDSKRWIGFALAGALNLGVSIFLNAVLSSHYGVAGMYPLCFGYIAIWLFYRGLINCDFIEFYYKKRQTAVTGVLLRGMNHLILNVIIFAAFNFANKASINQGVISSLFNSSIIFTSIIFCLLYKEKPSYKDLVGMVIMMCGVVLISVAKPSSIPKVNASDEN